MQVNSFYSPLSGGPLRPVKDLEAALSHLAGSYCKGMSLGEYLKKKG